MKKTSLIVLAAGMLALSACTFPTMISWSQSDGKSTSQTPSKPSEPGSEGSETPGSSSSSSSTPGTEEPVVSSTLNSKIYVPNQDQQTGTITTSNYDLPTTYFVGYNEIPYLKAVTALSLFHDYHTGYSITQNDGVLTVNNGSYLPDRVTFDAQYDTVEFADYEHFVAGGSGTDIATPSCGDVSYYPYLKLVSSELLDDDRSLIFYLDDYDADILWYQNNVYVPAGHMFAMMLGCDLGIAFNGDNYYLTYDSVLTQNNSYTSVVYSGSYAKKTSRSSAYAAYNYSYLCFLFDHFYGLADDSNLKPFDSTFQTKGYKTKLLSTSVSTYNNALFNFVEQVLDEGHSHTDYKSYYGTSVATSGSPTVSGTRNSSIMREAQNVATARYNAGKDVGFETSGTLAVLRFDQFVDYFDADWIDDSDSYDPSSEYFDVFTFFYHYFGQLNKNVTKDVVIDLSFNGGGEVGALFGAIGFLGRTFTTSITNPLTGSVMHETYAVDTNLDGQFNSSDGYQGQYNFYILTSGYSYSCATFMPELCAENGIATPIGKKSGGGACSVGYFATQDGAMGWLSSNNLCAYLKDGDYVNYEHGYPVESRYQISSYSDYFNMSSLATRVRGYAS